MELVILLLVVLGGIGWFIWSERQHEKSGNHPLDGATKSSVLDVNKDGKVDIKDAVAVVAEVKTVAKKTAKKVKDTAVAVEKDVVAKVKKPRKPKSQ
ncbi:hypothetical protein UFOVP257_207 [uncultured Caudovirales phage]|uniref:EF-hand domain-containing protein n=1 Tax=uncultured Caudovirales phage TaxID=2100421 RepID=A0A6J5LK67_9CAUD|nr:hypothetical protein UFOVP257_207 [uncultured Caudovirales phage]